jgi:phosphoribosylcarboxyaminoimidazole (NCAIR) mutase
MSQISVLILIGSDSDAPVMQPAVDLLREFGVPCEMTVASAHRSPARVQRLLGDAPGRGVKVFIVGAGAAAHLAGMVAALTTRPVIGVPIDSSALKGLDALLSTVQMPRRWRRRRPSSQRCDRAADLCRAGTAVSGQLSADPLPTASWPLPAALR